MKFAIVSYYDTIDNIDIVFIFAEKIGYLWSLFFLVRVLDTILKKQ